VTGTIYEELLAVRNGGNASIIGEDLAGGTSQCPSVRTQLLSAYGANTVFREHIIWWQGETDAETTAAAEAYEGLLADLVAAFFTDFPAPTGFETKIWIVPLHGDVSRDPDQEMATVNAAFDAVAATDSRITVVANSDMVSPLQSVLAHWMSWAYHEMVRRVADAILA
jgi:hypothetical protein